MSPKPTASELPPLDDELTPLRNLRPRGVSDAATQANARALGEQWGVTTQIPKPAPATPLESLRLDIPDYLALELRLRCAREKVTNAYLIMKALAKDGFTVEEKDLVPDRYKRKRGI